MKPIVRFAPSLLALLMGCAPQLVSGGEDSAYLKEIAPPAQTTSQKLLPLAPGTFWEMNGISEKRITRDKIVVVGPKQVGTSTGTHLQLFREGALWRQEVYKNDDSGLSLLAFGEKQQELLVLSPPLPLLKATLHEGDEITWKGSVRFKGKDYLSTAYTRVTAQENLQTRTGRFQCFRIDSVLTMSRPKEQPLHFPSIRWLSEKIGFVRRSFADAGKPALQDLERYQVQSK